MNRRQSASDERLDIELRETLGGIAPVTLSADFGDSLMRRIHQQKRAISGTTVLRWTMRVYWLLAALATMGILYLVGSPDPRATWTAIAVLLLGLSLGKAPLLLFGPRQRVGLLDLILLSVR